MVERTTKRTHRIDGDDNIAIKEESWINGKGKKVVQTIEEHNISLDEINQVINTFSEEEHTKVQEETEKLQKEIKEIKEEIKDIVHDRDYLLFKKKLDDPKTKEYFETIKKEKGLSSAKSRLTELERIDRDIFAC